MGLVPRRGSHPQAAEWLAALRAQDALLLPCDDKMADWLAGLDPLDLVEELPEPWLWGFGRQWWLLRRRTEREARTWLT